MKTDAINKMWADDMYRSKGEHDPLHGQVHFELGLIESHKCPDLQARVADFHRACGLPVASEPSVGTPEQRELRVRLMLEEVLEFAKAAGVSVELNGFRIKGTAELKLWISHHANLVEMTHELADVQYVTSGTAVELGLPLPEAFSEVHGANMRKVGPDGKVVMVNGKVMKPEWWVPADVSSLLAK